MRRVALSIAVLAVLAGCVCFPSRAGAAPRLPSSAYSWDEVLGEAALMNPTYQSQWALTTPFRTKKGQPSWNLITMPYGQPNFTNESPSSDVEIGFTSPGTAVYAIASGTILSVTMEVNEAYTIVQDVDFNGDGVGDGVKVEYRHVAVGRRPPQVGQLVTSATALGTVGLADTGDAKLGFTVLAYQRTYDHEGTMNPYEPFYSGAAGWDAGSDTAFIKDSWNYSNERGKVYVKVYAVGPGGAHVPPSEVTIFHDHWEGGFWWPDYRESPMTPIGNDTYVFDFMTYTETAPDGSTFNYYPPDGGVVMYLIRARYDSSLDPDAYEWAFTPMAYARPYENPNDWDQQWYYGDVDPGHDVYSWGQNVPFIAPEEGQWYSQIDPSQADPKYSWNDYDLDRVFFPNVVNPVDGTQNTPLEWNEFEQGPYESPDPDVPHLVSGIINTWGCTACSWAMVLANLGVTTPARHPDIRLNGWTGYMVPDPFTVTLANTGWVPLTYSSGRYVSQWVSAEDPARAPVYIVNDAVANGFGVGWTRENFVWTTLETGIDSAATTLTVKSATGFPAPPFLISIDGEVMRVEAVSPADPRVFTTVTRGLEGTTPFLHTEGAQVNYGTDEVQARRIHELLKTHPEGVIVRLPGHSMVFYKSNLTDEDFPVDASGFSGLIELSDDQQAAADAEWWNSVLDQDATDVVELAVQPTTAYEMGFIVFDPATANPANGAGVTYDLCYSFLRGRRLSQVQCVDYLIK